LFDQAVLLRNHWYYQQRNVEFTERLQRSKPHVKVEKLHAIRSVIVTRSSDGASTDTKCYDREVWKETIKTEFCKRWACKDLHRRSLILDLLASFTSVAVTCDFCDVQRALDNLKPSKRIDSDGVCVLAARIIAISDPTALPDVLNTILADDKTMTAQTVNGIVKGKRSRDSRPEDCRAILPMPTLLGIADYILARRLVAFIDDYFEKKYGVYFGAVPGTQCTEIAAGVQMCFEKGLDLKGEVAAADMDIANFYDSVCPIIFVRWAMAASMPRELIASCLRALVCPTISLSVGNSSFVVPPRTRGLFTGSRLANAIGRVPFLDSLQRCYGDIRELGFPVADKFLLLAAWVDNITSVSTTAFRATKMLERLAAVLSAVWNLDIKPGSRSYMSVLPADRVEDGSWRFCSTMHLLGHFLSSNCCPQEAFRLTHTAAWKAFYAKLCCDGIIRLGPPMQAVQLDRYILPILRYRWVNWPFEKSIAGKIDSMQNRMLSTLMNTQPLPDEEIPIFVQRRCRLANAFASVQGSWSLRWAADILNWNAHCKRNHNGSIWTRDLETIMTTAELQRKRATFCINSTSWSCHAGRTGTRHRAGAVSVRTDQSLAAAHGHIQEKGAAQTLKRIKRLSR
jgi:hypothetical protein